MSLKAELEIWSSALNAYDAQKFEEALELFSRIADSSKILTNIGLIYATIGEHERAIEHFITATQLDQYLAIGYFQCGVSNFLLTRYDLAYQNFEETFSYLRGNTAINYEQLGLKFRLFSCEVLFNQGLTLIYLGRVMEGMQLLDEARKVKVTDEHVVIDEAIQDEGQGYTVFSIPVGVLYRPSENKIKNAKQKDYLGKAKLVATADATDVFTTFAGPNRLKQVSAPQGVFVDDLQPPSELSRSVTVPPPRVVDDPISPLQRSKTTIFVPDNARERIRGDLSQPSADESRSPGKPANEPPNAAGVGLLRIPPKRKDSAPEVRNVINTSQTAAKFQPNGNGLKSTQFVEDYIDSYRNTPPSRQAPTRSNTMTRGPSVKRPRDFEINNLSVQRSPSTNRGRAFEANNQPVKRAPSRNASTVRKQGLRRQLTRSNTVASFSRRSSEHEEEEEGYASGDYEEPPVFYELAKIRVRVHYNGDVRGMALVPDTPYEEFMNTLAIKFGVAEFRLDVKFKDEDGGKVSLKDEMDYEMALETAKETARGKSEGMLEIWCTDV